MVCVCVRVCVCVTADSRCAYGKMASFYALFFEKGFDGDPRARHAETILAIVFCGVF